MLRRTTAAIILLGALASVGCSGSGKGPSAKTALKATTGESEQTGTRLYRRETLTAARTNALADFILPQVRQKLDEEPVSQDEIPESYAPQEYGGGEYVDNSETLPGEDSLVNPDELDKLKFSWMKKKYGETLKKEETSRGLLVLYADENYYDVGRLAQFVEDGRDRLATETEIDANRIQVVYGGYRGLAQVEFWIVPQGQDLPELKPEIRNTESRETN